MITSVARVPQSLSYTMCSAYGAPSQRPVTFNHFPEVIIIYNGFGVVVETDPITRPIEHDLCCCFYFTDYPSFIKQVITDLDGPHRRPTVWGAKPRGNGHGFSKAATTNGNTEPCCVVPTCIVNRPLRVAQSRSASLTARGAAPILRLVSGGPGQRLSPSGFAQHPHDLNSPVVRRTSPACFRAKASPEGHRYSALP